ncbi:GNAT family N-acetyltransferase [Pseudomonas sp. ABC1]|uniref:GNAT family N-acetyltransferase n=1 Tax=Pseudomonas sp. ABC1 TaxID=2748080 RepID=UPI0015C3C7F1|nr:GNAT family N-acetyltransferase [Pseudomonas sp. ABC1]QLF93004.1 GNAT family N-acetyltransferase [Pseudomonas sp. ABC1]
MAEVIEFETERLSLRQWCPADREPFAALNADPRVMEFFPSALARDESDALADRCQALITERGWGVWAVACKRSQAFVGFVGLHVPSAALPFSPCVEIAWRLGFAHWGRGFATEAAAAVLRVGFDVLQLPEIVSFTAVANQRSRAVMERLGMQASGMFEHPEVPEGSPLRRHCLYRLPAGRAQNLPSICCLSGLPR